MLKEIVRALVLGVGLTLAAAPAEAVLMNHGSNGEYFFDTETGLYWWDPVTFVSQSKTEIDSFVSGDADWSYASYQQLRALLGQMSVGGVSLVEIMGTHQLRTSLGSPEEDRSVFGSRWVGFYDGVCPLGPCLAENPDGWNIQTLITTGPLLSDLSVIGSSSGQVSVDVVAAARGAWINSLVDPLAAAMAVPEPASLALFGAGLAGLGALGWRRRKA